MMPRLFTSACTRFEYWDEDRSNSLDKDEVTRALVHTLDLGKDLNRLQAVRDCVEAVWPIFDTDGSGTIEKDEFILPNDGLADMIIATLQLR